MYLKRQLQIYRDGKSRNRSLIEPLREGEQGNMQTLETMAQIVREDRGEPDLRNFILREIVRDVRGHDFLGEVRTIFEFARDKITYRKDPFNVERVADLWSTLYALNANGPEGDCGIKSHFIATCAAALGHKPYFVVIKQRPEQKAFNHVYAMVIVNEKPVYCDATPEESELGFEVHASMKKLYPIFD